MNEELVMRIIKKTVAFLPSVIVIVIVIFFATCSLGGNVETLREKVDEESALPALTGTVSISGTAQAGQTLTADISGLGGSGTIAYQWKRNESFTIGTNSSTYTITAADAGFAITVTVTRSGNSGSVTSSQAGPIGLPVLTGTVSISGNALVGQTLTADISGLGGSGTIAYQWKRNGSITIGTNSGTYTITAADAGFAITVTVTRSGNSNSVTSLPAGPVRMDIITGDPYVGDTLGVDIGALGGSGIFSYQWIRGGTTVVGTNSGNYTLTAADAGLTITVTVERTGISVVSAPTAVIKEKQTGLPPERWTVS